MRQDLVIIGGGLAGAEAAWQAANHGAKVTLYEMRPKTETAAHKTEQLAEIVCSNSLGSNDPLSAPGILKQEMRQLGSLIIKVELPHFLFENPGALSGSFEPNELEQTISASCSVLWAAVSVLGRIS